MKRIALLLLLFASLSPADAADTLRLTLDDVVRLARIKSTNAAVALNELKTAYWQYRTYRANRLPEINFTATLPSYRKQYSSYQLEDGSYTFVHDNYLGMNGMISVDQIIPWTGGKVSLTTSLDFMRQPGKSGMARYMSVPVALRLDQPLFGVNPYKWDRLIEPVRYREAQAAFLEASEQVAMQAIANYFDLLAAESDVEICRQNLDNSRRLYDVAKIKRVMGQISKNDSLQMELNCLEAETALITALSAQRSAMFSLCSLLALDDDTVLMPMVPKEPDAPEIDFTQAMTLAWNNNAFARNIRRRQLEADYEVAKAKGNLLDIKMHAQIGYTGEGRDLSGAYNPLKDNQLIEIGFSIPLLDWGKRRGQLKMARSNRELVKSRTQREEMEFRQDLYILVERLNNQRAQVKLASQSENIANVRYNTNVEAYIHGNVSTLDLNDSQLKKDETRGAYIDQLRLYWWYYYRLRSLTLWDFEKNCRIDADFETIVK